MKKFDFPKYNYLDKSINYYKVGCNFDMGLIDLCVDLNKKYEGTSKVVEFFGSTKEEEETAGRPGWRLQDLDRDYVEKFVKKALDAGILFNWTMNSIQPYGSKSEMVKHKKDIQDTVLWLESIGVYRITIANPMLALFIREVSDIEMELSCIAHIDTVTQFKYYHEVFGVNKFCVNLMKNRNKEWLTRAQHYCDENNLIMEVLCNEFCGVGGTDKEGTPYMTHCALRDSCYLCHACNKTKEESMSYNNYPMGYCMTARGKNEEGWLRLRWIRPEDQPIYRNIGVNYFKVTGRTGTLEYMKYVLEAYMSENLQGNILTVWKPLQTIYSGQGEQEYEHPEYIDNKKLDGFLDKWFVGSGWECENHMCGTDCKWCQEFYLKHLKND